MFNKESIKYSLTNLKKRKGRSILTLLSILIGIATIFIFISFGYGLYNYTNEFSTSSSVDKVLILTKGPGGLGMDTAFTLGEDDLEAVESAAGVFSASGVYFTAAEIKSRKEQKFSFLIAYDTKNPIIMEMFNVGIEKGRELRPGDKKKILLGNNYMLPNKIFTKPLDLNDVIEIDGVDMKVIGFMESIGNPQDDSQLYIDNEYFEGLYPNNTYQQIIAKVDIEQIERTIENIEKKLRKERGLEKGEEDFFVQSFEDLIASFSIVLNVIVGFVILIALISVFISAINTANTMITSVLERYKEIGILKAIGSKNSTIFGIFLFESAFLGLVAGVLGVLIGWGFSSLGGKLLADLGYGFLSPFFSKELFIGLILFATITGAISGAWPAYKASKTNIVDAIRYE